jgi:hypothetical protein
MLMSFYPDKPYSLPSRVMAKPTATTWWSNPRVLRQRRSRVELRRCGCVAIVVVTIGLGMDSPKKLANAAEPPD